jgi:hypothetical protein
MGGALWRATFTATVRNAMPHTLTTAAAANGLNRTTILGAVKSGKISGAKDEHGEWHIEPCELHRVYPPIARTDAAPQHATSDDVELRIRATLAEARLAYLKASLDDMRSQRDNSDDSSTSGDQRSNRQPSQTTQSLWSRLTGIWTPLLGGSPKHM